MSYNPDIYHARLAASYSVRSDLVCIGRQMKASLYMLGMLPAVPVLIARDVRKKRQAQRWLKENNITTSF